ncbi:hypothetical protein OH76DRAFT_1351220 [Lentinus brumalis]|uniref:Uncharacterized protein n=1 Tax=Lentinus brumalis TaxID=2498619 RepID=A0A371D9E8_9APHY|nr:hypothetical protein OH76DRAFT_1351220 [Polyporus brumalis]
MDLPRQPVPPAIIDSDDAPRERCRSGSPPPALEFRSSTNAWSMYRVFPVKPARDPDEEDRSLASYCDPVAFDVRAAESRDARRTRGLAVPDERPPYSPFPNVSTFEYVYWQNTGANKKSDQQINGLARVMQEDDFNASDLAGFDAARELKRLDDYTEDDVGSPFSAQDGWIEGEVHVHVPKEGVCYASEDKAPVFTLKGVWHRRFREVIRSSLQQESVKDWHMVPHRLYPSSSSPSPEPCTSRSSSAGSSSSSTSSSSFTSSSSRPNDSPEEDIRVWSEIFNSDTALEEDATIRAQPRQAGDPDDLEYCVTLICLYSDSTRLTNFGKANLWPIYLYFGNQSKYTRGRPTAYAARHMAYIPSLPDQIQDFYTDQYDESATTAVLKFLRRELVQQILLLLLDDEFMYIYVHGDVVVCGDGITRRQFPRFVLHTADFLEKILLTCLKFISQCPCPRCKVPRARLIEMGTRADDYRRNKTRVDDNDVNWRITLARKWIFEDGMPLTSVYIDRILGSLSLTPTRSAYSIKLREHNFNFYSLFAPDFMHEVELGVWRTIFTHLMRILHAVGEDSIQTFNKRFRQVPTFGRSTIRKFSRNVCDQGKLAARDYEDRLQCFMPVFEGLLKSKADNRMALDLIFDLATLHALGKLRMHVPKTIEALGTAASNVGTSTRVFISKVCSKYATVELPKELAARGRRKARKPRKAGAPAPTVRGRKELNCNTPKFHALRDYATTVLALGPLDNSSAHTGEVEHIHSKDVYGRTNKVNHEAQIARRTLLAEKLRMIRTRVDTGRARRKKLMDARERKKNSEAAGLEDNDNMKLPSEDDEKTKLPYSSATQRYHVAKSQRSHDNIFNWVSSFGDDPALIDFYLKLKEHALSRLEERGQFDPGYDTSAGYSFQDRARLVIHKEQLYWHDVVRLNWTSYDLQRSQDAVNPRNHADIMLLAHNTGEADAHPYLYARVVRVFHINVRLYDSPMASFERMDVLFVRWFRIDPSVPGGLQQKRLHRVEFVPHGGEEEACGFVNPVDVVRGCHIIAAFAHGRVDTLLGPSMARKIRVTRKSDKAPEDDKDFRYHYVNFFVDRDMFMRYFGGGIGHRGVTQRTSAQLDEEDADSDWQDIVEDAPTEAARPEDLLELVPEIAQAGVGYALQQELEIFRAGLESDDGEESDEEEDEEQVPEWELEDEDGRPENVGMEGDALAQGLEEEYEIFGYAAP